MPAAGGGSGLEGTALRLPLSPPLSAPCGDTAATVMRSGMPSERRVSACRADLLSVCSERGRWLWWQMAGRRGAFLFSFLPSFPRLRLLAAGSAARGFFHSGRIRAKCREAAPRCETSYGKVGVLEWVLQAPKTARRLLRPSLPYDDTTATPRRESLFAPRDRERASGEAELELGLAPGHSSGRVLWPVCGPPRLEGRRSPSHPHDSLRASTDQGRKRNRCRFRLDLLRPCWARPGRSDGPGEGIPGFLASWSMLPARPRARRRPDGRAISCSPKGASPYPKKVQTETSKKKKDHEEKRPPRFFFFFEG